ncbi:MAG: class I SAM-dependent methyltransferase [bacterium]
MSESMSPYGKALTDYYQGDDSAEIIYHRDDGHSIKSPVQIFFREESDMSIIEKKALQLCFGDVLDIGAGTGLHSLILQNEGLNVKAIDISPKAVEIMKNRGVKNVECRNIFKYEGEKFDTLLMLLHGIGITGNLKGFHKYLKHAYELTKSNGIIVFDSLDVRCTDNPKHLEYHEYNRKRGRYIGEIQMQIEYKGEKGKPFNWLHIDPDTLNKEIKKNKWDCEIIHKESSGDYLAKLKKE